MTARATPRRLGRRAATVDVAAWQDGRPERPVALARMLLVADAPAPLVVSRLTL